MDTKPLLRASRKLFRKPYTTDEIRSNEEINCNNLTLSSVSDTLSSAAMPEPPCASAVFQLQTGVQRPEDPLGPSLRWWSGAWTQERESEDRSRLSPITNTCFAETTSDARIWRPVARRMENTTPHCSQILPRRHQRAECAPALHDGGDGHSAGHRSLRLGLRSC